MNILDQIIKAKRVEVENRKKACPISSLATRKEFSADTVSLIKKLGNPGETGIIAEFKRKSPSLGVINANSDIQKVCSEYESSGASAVSVLTDTDYFGGTISDLEQVKKTVQIPVLRKDFIVDEYQILESKAAGADLILLIAAVHDKTTLESLYRFAVSLGLEVLVEVHDESCISKIPADAKLVGINCRDLKSFSLETSAFINLLENLPASALKIAESGITSPEHYVYLRKAGFDGCLIGTNFMKTENPGKGCREFIDTASKLMQDE